MVRTRGKATTVATTENNSGSDVELNSDSATPEANDKPLKSNNQKTTRRRISTESKGSAQEMAAQDDSDIKKEDSEEETPQVQKPRKTIFVCEVSTEDTPGPSKRRNKSMKKSSLRFYKRETRTRSRNDEHMELESYYESDEEEEFMHSRRQRYWESDEANSVRRSTRQRKPARNLCDSSWIFSTKNPKGYPTLRDEDQDEVVGCRRSSRLLTNQHSSHSCGDLEKDSKSESDGDNKSVKNGVNTDGDADETAQENEEHKKAPRRLRRNVTESLHDEEDMYSKVKRRNTKPSYNNYSSRLSKAKRLRSKKRPARRYTAPSTEESTSETEDEAEDTTDEETEGSQNDAAKEADADIEGRRAKGKYLLRKIQPAIKQANDNKSSSRSSTPPPRYRDRDSSRLFRSPAHRTLRKPRQTAQNDSSTSSSSDDEERFERRKSKSMLKARSRFLPMNITAEDLGQGVLKERSKIGSSLADVDPMALDKNVTFESVGGLDSYISSLKEMILFPLVYPEVFHKFSIQPPRGVLFYGPPGTGKTLVARALSNECGGDGRRVAFFMRKGADCLSKWVGESERQLRLLFDQAYQMRPSIIFFDEIDGLAPVRSTRQDQIHSSIVSTLLALMDGLDSRGEVVVIGATNRLDAIDPALRRPGRFDREFFFPLPSMMARKEILGIHLKSWDPLPSPALVETLAEKTVGYCGADLKALCAEAALVSLRRRYPQIYDAKQKLLLDLSQISVDERDFFTAMNRLTPASHRSGAACGKPLSATVTPLLNEALQSLIQRVQQVFPQALHVQNMKGPTNQIKFGLQGLRFSPRLYVTRDQGSHLTPALLHFLERVPVHRLDLTTLFGLSARTPEEACVQTFQEARRNVPSIVYLPQVGCWWNTLSETVRATLFSVIRELDPELPVLILASDETDYSEMPDELTSFFSDQDEEIFAVPDFSDEQRRHFFSPLFETAKKPPHVPETVEKNVEPLPVAPLPPPRQLSDKEKARIEMKEEFTLRELRIFLREILAKLARNKLFYMFTRPVDVEEVPDYLDIIKQPMDLETMMTKIDDHCYESAKDFLADIDLICSNALEYNPSKTPEDKMIRHRAFTLRDTAYALIKAEMDTDFEDQCQEISRSRKVRHNISESVSTPAPAEVNQETVAEAPTVSPATAPSAKEPKEKAEPSKQKRKKTSSWARGVVPRRSAKRNKTDESIDTSEADKSEVLMEVTNGTSEALAIPEATEDQINNSTGSNQTDSEVLENQEGSGLNETSGGLIVVREHLELLLEKAVQISKGFSLQRILRVHSKLNRVAAKYSHTLERSKLTQDMEEVLNCIQKGEK